MANFTLRFILTVIIFIASIGIYKSAYRLALYFFINARFKPIWDIPAAITCYLSLVPIVFTMSKFFIEIVNHFIYQLPYSNFIALNMTLFVIFVLAPQVVKSGKEFALSIEEEVKYSRKIS